jgi:predicted regulator of Ras-like GTPase activity (Roadblock/LC7/MglB family)
MTDHVRVWSDELARDPSSLVFLPLAETLRRRGQVDLARKVAVRGIERHPHNPDAHDQLARIHADAGDLQAAFEEWAVVLRLVPGHIGAIKGMAFIRFQQGELVEAERLLLDAQGYEHVAGLGGGGGGGGGGGSEDGDISAAIRAVRRSGSMSPVSVPAIEASSEPSQLFADLLAPEHSGILLRSDGAVLAGSYVTGDGRDRARAIGAALAGMPGEATRATRHLDLGIWRAIVFETEAAVVSIAPAGAPTGADALLMLTAPPTAPLGLLRRMLERCVARASSWLGTRPSGSAT